MLVDIQGRKMVLTPPLKDYALSKVGVVNKYLDSSLRIHITLSVDKFRQRAEVAVNGKGIRLHGVEETEDMYASIDKVMDKIARQARKFKEKRKDHHGRSKEAPEEQEVPVKEEMAKVITAKLDPVKPMSTEDAIGKLGEGNLQFIVFRNSPDEKVNVLYHRSDGNFGLIET